LYKNTTATLPCINFADAFFPDSQPPGKQKWGFPIGCLIMVPSQWEALKVKSSDYRAGSTVSRTEEKMAGVGIEHILLVQGDSALDLC